MATKKNKWGTRRVHKKGQPPVARKYYPKITKEQERGGLAPKMATFINRNRDSLTDAVNAPNALNADRRMPRSNARGAANAKLRSRWGAAMGGKGKGNSVGQLARKRNMTRGEVRSALGAANEVSVSHDPFHK